MSNCLANFQSSSGLFLGVCTDSYREVIPCGGTGPAIGAVIFAVGALMPTDGWHDVNRAR